MTSTRERGWAGCATTSTAPSGSAPADHDLLVRYVVVNTFDRITPEYTNSAGHETIEGWTREAGFSSVETWGRGGVRARAIK